MNYLNSITSGMVVFNLSYRKIISTSFIMLLWNTAIYTIHGIMPNIDITGIAIITIVLYVFTTLCLLLITLVTLLRGIAHPLQGVITLYISTLCATLSIYYLITSMPLTL